MRDQHSPSFRERIILSLGGYSPLLTWYRAKRPVWIWRLTSPFGRPTCRYVGENGLTIKRGPFAGLKFPKRSLGHTNYLASKLAGVYEPPVVEFLVEQAPAHEHFVDLGSGDGFFLTGIGMKNPDIELIGYEINRHERELAREISAENSVAFEARECADHEELKKLPANNLLLLCDLEGLEEDLLDPIAVPQLTQATMAVETHVQFRPNVIQVLRDRFEESHEVTVIPAERANPADLPELAGRPSAEADFVVHDGHRSGEGWMTLVPRDISG